MYDICIIGGGASGMTAAAAAAMNDPSLRICILEKKEMPGKKLRATGNGRCNLSNVNCPNVSTVTDFFDRIGVMTVAEENGWMYPASRQGEDVAFALVSALKRYNIEIIVNKSVQKIEKEGDHFVVDGEMKARFLLLAAGGKAGPQYGTTGDGFQMARAMGHRIRKPVPVLTALKGDGLADLKGVRARGRVSLFCKGEFVIEEEGEIQFVSEGVSGICIFNLSRFVRLKEDTAFKDYELRIDFLPFYSRKELEGIIEERITEGVDPIRSMVPSRLCQMMYKKAAASKDLARELKDFRITVTGARGWDWAQCTSGGVEMSQIDEKTMESRLVNGLFFAGEILDYDGSCGGYNLQNAWETGIKAGREIASRRKR